MEGKGNAGNVSHKEKIKAAQIQDLPYRKAN